MTEQTGYNSSSNEIIMSELIFKKYLDDMCPVCDAYVSDNSQIGHTESGGKCMAQHFRCQNCKSEYTVGFNRPRYPINSKITLNTLYK